MQRSISTADMRAAPEETNDEIVAYYERVRADANAVIDELDLITLGDARDARQVSLRWVPIHMIEETARHTGHMDILRELLDGVTGDHRPES